MPHFKASGPLSIQGAPTHEKHQQVRCVSFMHHRMNGCIDYQKGYGETASSILGADTQLGPRSYNHHRLPQYKHKLITPWGYMATGSRPLHPHYMWSFSTAWSLPRHSSSQRAFQPGLPLLLMSLQCMSTVHHVRCFCQGPDRSRIREMWLVHTTITWITCWPEQQAAVPTIPHTHWSPLSSTDSPLQFCTLFVSPRCDPNVVPKYCLNVLCMGKFPRILPCLSLGRDCNPPHLQKHG
jgi:hypothetical protein